MNPIELKLTWLAPCEATYGSFGGSDLNGVVGMMS